MSACRLYLAAPADEDVKSLRQSLQQAHDMGADIAALRLPANPALGKLISFAQGLNIAVLIQDDIDLAASLKADGVEVASLEAYKNARSQLGPDALIGALCGNSRHDAMALGEAGADYIALAPDLIEWWAGLFEPACVCELDLSLENATDMIKAGADFIRPQNWADAPALTQLIAELGA